MHVVLHLMGSYSYQSKSIQLRKAAYAWLTHRGPELEIPAAPLDDGKRRLRLGPAVQLWCIAQPRGQACNRKGINTSPIKHRKKLPQGRTILDKTRGTPWSQPRQHKRHHVQSTVSQNCGLRPQPLLQTSLALKQKSTHSLPDCAGAPCAAALRLQITGQVHPPLV